MTFLSVTILSIHGKHKQVEGNGQGQRSLSYHTCTLKLGATAISIKQKALISQEQLPNNTRRSFALLTLLSGFFCLV
jgi:hypothetical protein